MFATKKTNIRGLSSNYLWNLEGIYCENNMKSKFERTMLKNREETCYSFYFYFYCIYLLYERTDFGEDDPWIFHFSVMIQKICILILLVIYW